MLHEVLYLTLRRIGDYGLYMLFELFEKNNQRSSAPLSSPLKLKLILLWELNTNRQHSFQLCKVFDRLGSCGAIISLHKSYGFISLPTTGTFTHYPYPQTDNHS